MIKVGRFMFMEDPESLEEQYRAVALGDAIQVVESLAPGTVDCWVTSPPYFRQIDYDHPDQCGLEASMVDYIWYQTLLADRMFKASKETATLFWVIRDSSNKTGGPGGDYREPDGSYRCSTRGPNEKGWPRKSQLLIPERTRIAFANAGWVPMMVVVWDKDDARRGAVDRPSYSYEWVLVFTKNPDHYWNRESVLQEYAKSSVSQLGEDYTGQSDSALYVAGEENPSDTKRRICKSMKRKPGAYLRQVWRIPSGSQPRVNVSGKIVRGKACFPLTLAEICVCLGCPPGGVVADPYMGFGTTMIAAHKWGRAFIGGELNPETKEAAEIRFAEYQAKSWQFKKVA